MRLERRLNEKLKCHIFPVSNPRASASHVLHSRSVLPKHQDLSTWWQATCYNKMGGQGHEAVEVVTIAWKMEGLRPWEA